MEEDEGVGYGFHAELEEDFEVGYAAGVEEALTELVFFDDEVG